MRVYFRVKAVGKRKPVLELVESSLPDDTACLEDAIRAIVTDQVRQFNDRSLDQAIFSYLSPEQLEDQAQAGKVGFQAAYDDRKADEAKSIQTALQAFEDGIYKVLMDEHVVESLREPLVIRPEAIFTFIRLTMLSGTMY